jgi:hypothetical protein
MPISRFSSIEIAKKKKIQKQKSRKMPKTNQE